MSDSINRNLTIKLDDIAHLFVAPEFDPFSDQDAELLGQPAFVYLLRKLGPDRLKQGPPISLTVQLPPEKVTLDLNARVEQALHRYCEVRIADDQAEQFTRVYLAVDFLVVAPLHVQQRFMQPEQIFTQGHHLAARGGIARIALIGIRIFGLCHV